MEPVLCHRASLQAELEPSGSDSNLNFQPWDGSTTFYSQVEAGRGMRSNGLSNYGLCVSGITLDDEPVGS